MDVMGPGLNPGFGNVLAELEMRHGEKVRGLEQQLEAERQGATAVGMMAASLQQENVRLSQSQVFSQQTAEVFLAQASMSAAAVSTAEQQAEGAHHRLAELEQVIAAAQVPYAAIEQHAKTVTNERAQSAERHRHYAEETAGAIAELRANLGHANERNRSLNSELLASRAQVTDLSARINVVAETAKHEQSVLTAQIATQASQMNALNAKMQEVLATRPTPVGAPPPGHLDAELSKTKAELASAKEKSRSFEVHVLKTMRQVQEDVKARVTGLIAERDSAMGKLSHSEAANRRTGMELHQALLDKQYYLVEAARLQEQLHEYSTGAPAPPPATPVLPLIPAAPTLPAVFDMATPVAAAAVAPVVPDDLPATTVPVPAPVPAVAPAPAAVITTPSSASAPPTAASPEPVPTVHDAAAVILAATDPGTTGITPSEGVKDVRTAIKYTKAYTSLTLPRSLPAQPSDPMATECLPSPCGLRWVHG